MHHPNPAIVANIAWWIITLTACFSAFCGLCWTIWIIRAFRRDLKRDREGLCMRCGYDLRHSLQRCPECGEPIRNRKSQKV
jgi:predicted amidophosphoribosyltransferase